MRSSTLSVLALSHLLTTLTLSNPTSPRHILSPRTYFPNCVNATNGFGGTAPCSCTCESGFVTNSNAPNEVGQYIGCIRESESAYYSPVGCLTCTQNTTVTGEFDYLGPRYAFDWGLIEPKCSNDCAASAFSPSMA